jgi:MoxR-like ATPase
MSSKVVNLNIDECKSFLRHILTNNIHLQENGKVPTSVNIEGPAGLGKTSIVAQLAKELDYNLVRLNLATIEELGDLIGFPVRQFQLCKEITAPLENTIVKKPQTISETIKVPKMVKKLATVNKQVQKQVMGPDGKLAMRMVTIPVQEETEVEEMVDEVVTKTIMVEELVTGLMNSVAETECLWIDENAIEEYIKQGYSFTGQKRMSYCPPEWIAGLDDKPGILILDDYSRADQRFIQACMTLN